MYILLKVDDNDNDGNGRLSTANRKDGSSFGQGWKTDYYINNA